MFARSSGLCFPWVPGVSHGGAADEVLAQHPTPTGRGAGRRLHLQGARGCASPFQAFRAILRVGPRRLCDRGEEACHSQTKDLGLNPS